MFNFTILRRDPRFVASTAILSIYGFAAVFAPWIAPFDPAANLGREGFSLLPPGSGHWLGTDLESRDVLSRLLHGARASLATAALTVTISVSLGTLVGVVAGGAGRAADVVLMRLTDLFLSIPSFIFILAAGAFFGKSQWMLVLVLSLASWMKTARLVRAEVRVVRNSEFVLAARGLGIPEIDILRKHVLPHVLGPAVVSATLGVGGVLAAEAALSFLGYGIQEPAPSWGRMIQNGMEQLTSGWWVSFFPAVSIALCVASATLLGDALRGARERSC